MGIELVKKQGHINLTAPKAIPVDLSNYYTKTETDGKIQEAVNAIPEVDLSNYATVDYVDNAVNNIEIPDVSEFITEIPSEYITETELNAKGYATTKDIPDTSAFQTEAQVNTLISNALNAIGVAEEGAY